MTPSSRLTSAIQRRFGSTVAAPDLPHPEALAALNERSVCRNYKPDPIPEPLFQLLCATALAAPTKSDLQQATIIRVADAAKRAKICATLPRSPWLAGAPELLVFCAEDRKSTRL